MEKCNKELKTEIDAEKIDNENVLVHLFAEPEIMLFLVLMVYVWQNRVGLILQQMR